MAQTENDRLALTGLPGFPQPQTFAEFLDINNPILASPATPPPPAPRYATPKAIGQAVESGQALKADLNNYEKRAAERAARAVNPLQAALIGVLQALPGLTKTSGYRNPLISAITGLAAGSTGVEQSVEERRKAELDNTPAEQAIPAVVEQYPIFKGMPLGKVREFIPLANALLKQTMGIMGEESIPAIQSTLKSKGYNEAEVAEIAPTLLGQPRTMLAGIKAKGDYVIEDEEQAKNLVNISGLEGVVAPKEIIGLSARTAQRTLEQRARRYDTIANGLINEFGLVAPTDVYGRPQSQYLSMVNKKTDALAETRQGAIIVGNLFDSYLKGTNPADTMGEANLRTFIDPFRQKYGKNPDLTKAEEIKLAYSSFLSRAMGERGVLTDADVQRALSFMPRFGDTKEQIKAKLNGFYEIYDGRVSNEYGKLPPNLSPNKKEGISYMRSPFFDVFAEHGMSVPKISVGGNKSVPAAQPSAKSNEARFDELLSQGKSEDEAYKIMAQEGR